MEPQPQGTHIGGRYTLHTKLGTGSMGAVWLADDHRLRRQVAIKVLGSRWAKSADARARFEHEAMAAAKLRSPHIVQIFDYGIEVSSPYIVMELLSGEDLRKRLLRKRSLDLLTAGDILFQTCKALRVAHEAGVVHRDLKPANLMLDDSSGDETVKVLDFGVAKSGADSATDATKAGALLGTPQFMAPEQARGLIDVDHRVDLWSLAVIMYRALAGVLPFNGQTVPDVIVAICTKVPTPVTHLREDLPPTVDYFFERAFARNRNERFKSATDLAAAFFEISAVSTPTFDRTSWQGIGHPSAAPVSERAPTEEMRGRNTLTGHGVRPLVDDDDDDDDDITRIHHRVDESLQHLAPPSDPTPRMPKGSYSSMSDATDPSLSEITDRMAKTPLRSAVPTRRPSASIQQDLPRRAPVPPSIPADVKGAPRSLPHAPPPPRRSRDPRGSPPGGPAVPNAEAPDSFVSVDSFVDADSISVETDLGMLDPDATGRVEQSVDDADETRRMQRPSAHELLAALASSPGPASAPSPPSGPASSRVPESSRAPISSKAPTSPPFRAGSDVAPPSSDVPAPREPPLPAGSFMPVENTAPGQMVLPGPLPIPKADFGEAEAAAPSGAVEDHALPKAVPAAAPVANGHPNAWVDDAPLTGIADNDDLMPGSFGTQMPMVDDLSMMPKRRGSRTVLAVLAAAVVVILIALFASSDPNDGDSVTAPAAAASSPPPTGEAPSPTPTPTHTSEPVAEASPSAEPDPEPDNSAPATPKKVAAAPAAKKPAGKGNSKPPAKGAAKPAAPQPKKPSAGDEDPELFTERY